MTEVLAVYTYPHYANKGKVEKVLDVLKEYRRTASKISALHWRHFFETRGKLNKYLKVKEIESKLSERYKQTCSCQVVAIIKGYLNSIQERISEIIWNSTLSYEDKIVLSYINASAGWLKFDEGKITARIRKQEVMLEVTEFHRRLIKSIFKRVLKRSRKLNFRYISMHLDQKVFTITPKKEGKAKNFDYWLSLATLDKGDRVYIPLKSNNYAEGQDGEFLNFIQIVEKDADIEIKRVKRLKPKDYIPVTPEIAIDLGLTPLVATDRGDLFGRNFLQFLIKLDEKITKRLQYLQKANIKPSKDEKYRKLVDKLRQFLKNEVNRMLNRIVEIYKPSKLIVERLDLRSPELSKRMNRLVQNFGKRYFKEKMQRLQELYGIEVEYINPAYTSQQCSSCDYIDEKNRKNTNEFKCKACGRRLNAQVNGARNILKRSSLRDLIKIHTPKKQVLRILVRQYLERLTGCDSAPWELLNKNPYFRDFLSNSEPQVCGINVYNEGTTGAERMRRFQLKQFKRLSTLG